MTRRSIAVALGNIPLQDQLCDALALAAGVDVQPCHTDAELLVLLAGHQLTGAVLGPRLVGLEHRVLPAVTAARVPSVLLVPAVAVGLHQARLAGIAPELRVVPDAASLAEIHAALARDPTTGPAVRAAGRQIQEPRRPRPATPRETEAGTRGRLIAVTSCGGQGCSTVVANTGFAYGAGRSVAVADLDLLRPALVPFLDRDPSLGLAGIVRADQMGVTALERVLDEHLQPLGDPGRSPHARLLGGLPLDGSTVAVTADLVVRLLETLRRRATLVLVDLGHVVMPTDQVGAVQRAVLLAADGILVVTGGDPVGVKRSQDYLARLVATAPHPDPARMALVVNRHDARAMEPPTEIADILGLPLAACVPADYRQALAAIGTPRPLVASGSGAAATQLSLLATALADPAWPPRTHARRVRWRLLADTIGRHWRRCLRSGRRLRDGARYRPVGWPSGSRSTTSSRSSEVRSS